MARNGVSVPPFGFFLFEVNQAQGLRTATGGGDDTQHDRFTGATVVQADPSVGGGQGEVYIQVGGKACCCICHGFLCCFSIRGQVYPQSQVLPE